MLEDDWSLDLQVLIEPQPVPSASEKVLQRCLASVERVASHVIPVELDQIERPHENVHIMPPVPDTIE
jgi:hypothetical protein